MPFAAEKELPFENNNFPTRQQRTKKGAKEYAEENPVDFTHTTTLLQEGKSVSMLVCKFCGTKVSTRMDRIKEHLLSKKHKKLRKQAGLDTEEEPAEGTCQQPKENVRVASSTYIPPRPAGQLDLDEDTQELTEIETSVESQKGRIAGKFYSEVDVNEHIAGQMMLLQQKGTGNPEEESKKTDGLYHLQWKTHGTIFRNAFINFQSSERLTDVLIVSGSNIIKCHKVVLTACSDYFANIFKQHPVNQPITIVMNSDIFVQLKALVSFMYHGEVTVAKDQLRPLLKIAEELGIWGLARRLNEPQKSISSPFPSEEGEVVDMSMPSRGETKRSSSKESKLPSMVTQQCSTYPIRSSSGESGVPCGGAVDLPESIRNAASSAVPPDLLPIEIADQAAVTASRFAPNPNLRDQVGAGESMLFGNDRFSNDSVINQESDFYQAPPQRKRKYDMDETPPPPLDSSLELLEASGSNSDPGAFMTYDHLLPFGLLAALGGYQLPNMENYWGNANLMTAAQKQSADNFMRRTRYGYGNTATSEPRVSPMEEYNNEEKGVSEDEKDF